MREDKIRLYLGWTAWVDGDGITTDHKETNALIAHCPALRTLPTERRWLEVRERAKWIDRLLFHCDERGFGGNVCAFLDDLLAAGGGDWVKAFAFCPAIAIPLLKARLAMRESEGR